MYVNYSTDLRLILGHPVLIFFTYSVAHRDWRGGRDGPGGQGRRLLCQPWTVQAQQILVVVVYHITIKGNGHGYLVKVKQWPSFKQFLKLCKVGETKMYNLPVLRRPGFIIFVWKKIIRKKKSKSTKRGKILWESVTYNMLSIWFYQFRGKSWVGYNSASLPSSCHKRTKGDNNTMYPRIC